MFKILIKTVISDSLLAACKMSNYACWKNVQNIALAIVKEHPIDLKPQPLSQEEVGREKTQRVNPECDS
jgi:hypothetical protein